MSSFLLFLKDGFSDIGFLVDSVYFSTLNVLPTVSQLPWFLKRNQLSVLLRITSVCNEVLLLLSRFIKFSKILVIMSSNTRSVLFSLTFLWDFSSAYINTLDSISEVLEVLSFFFPHCFSFCSSDWMISIDISSSSWVLSSACSNLCIHFIYYTFKLQNFCLILYYNLYFFIDIFIQ